MSALIYSMRDDLGLRSKDENGSLIYGLWASGVPSTTPQAKE